MKQRVAVWGTFDMLRFGHIQFLYEASKIGELYVIIIPDDVVEGNKGRKPIFSASERQEFLRNLHFVQGVYVDSYSEGLKSLDEIQPCYFVLGTKQDEAGIERLMELIQQTSLPIEVLVINRYFERCRSSDF